MQTNSKDPTQRYDKLERNKDIKLVLSREAGEIAKCKIWLENAAACYPAIAALTEKATRTYWLN